MAENEQYSSMEKEQLISLIHSFVKRDEERVQENQELKDMVRELWGKRRDRYCFIKNRIWKKSLLKLCQGRQENRQEQAFIT